MQSHPLHPWLHLQWRIQGRHAPRWPKSSVFCLYNRPLNCINGAQSALEFDNLRFKIKKNYRAQTPPPLRRGTPTPHTLPSRRIRPCPPPVCNVLDPPLYTCVYKCFQKKHVFRISAVMRILAVMDICIFLFFLCFSLS